MNRDDYLREYENNQALRERVAADPNRLHYHLMPPTGWLNDPNGLCQFHGVYHVYFQYTPFLASWGLKAWGHYTTRDWLHFREEEPFIFADTADDRDGVYSGSAFVQGDTIHYFYTGNVKYKDRDYDYILEGREHNTMHFTSKDGYTTTPKQVLMRNADYPADISKHVRDPKVYCRDGKYYMVQGARDRDSHGCVLLFRSDDLTHWENYNRIRTDEPFGYMWECPDLFDLDGQTLLLTCPQGVPQQGHLYQNVYQCGCFPITLDLAHNSYTLGAFRELDKGFDIYACQTFQDERGRRILIGWMGIPDADYDNDVTVEQGWIHALTMPRVLSWRDGRLIQQPMEEMQALRRTRQESNLRGAPHWETADCCFELAIWLTQSPERLALQLRDDVSLTYADGILTLQLGNSGRGRTTRTVELEQLRDLTVFSDTSSIEIFINGGEEVMTTRVYSSTLEQTIRLAPDTLDGSAVFYELDGYSIEKP